MLRKKGPVQFEGGGEKEKVPGGGKGAGKNNQFEGPMKKRVPEGGGWSPAQALCFVK